MRVSGVRVGGLALFAAGALLVGRAEATSRIFDLSPENADAAAVGPLTAYLEGQGGRGAIWLKLPSGDVETGRFEVKRGGSVGALGKAYGIDTRGAAYTGYGDPIMHGNPAVIDMTSPKGATVHCEVINDDAQDHGSGVCRFSNGAVYRVLY
jgi:hypothetical protein